MIHTLIRFAAPAEMQQVSEGQVLSNKTDWSLTHNSSSQGFCFFEPEDTGYMYFADMLEGNRCSIMGRKLYVCTIDDENPLVKMVFKKTAGKYFLDFMDGEYELTPVFEVCATVLCAAMFDSVYEYSIGHSAKNGWYIIPGTKKRII